MAKIKKKSATTKKKPAATMKKNPRTALSKGGTKKILPLSNVQPSKTPRTKSEIMALLSDTTGLTKRDVRELFESLNDLVGKDLGNKGCGMFTIPGLLKIRSVHKPAVKERKGINPFTKEEQMFKARPARNVVKVRPLKGLKDMV